MAIKTKVTSDLHGYLPNVRGKFDLMLICGDVCPAHDHYYAYQAEWLVNDFAEWIMSLSFNDKNSKVVMIPGNHDWAFEKFDGFKEELYENTKGRLVVLINEEYVFEKGSDSLSIFGTPYCKQFFNWAFMLPDELLQVKYSTIPYGCDILLTHDAPDINGLGTISQGFQNGVNAGNKLLATEVMEKHPRYLFCGHIHSGNHKLFEHEGIKMANVSYVDERYEPVNKILKVEI